jgi:hypothetical protein
LSTTDNSRRWWMPAGNTPRLPSMTILQRVHIVRWHWMGGNKQISHCKVEAMVFRKGPFLIVAGTNITNAHQTALSSRSAMNIINKTQLGNLKLRKTEARKHPGSQLNQSLLLPRTRHPLQIFQWMTTIVFSQRLRTQQQPRPRRRWTKRKEPQLEGVKGQRPRKVKLSKSLYPLNLKTMILKLWKFQLRRPQGAANGRVTKYKIL